MNVPQPISMKDFSLMVVNYIESEYDGVAGAFPVLSLEQRKVMTRIMETHYDPYKYDVVGAAGNLVDYLRKTQ